MVEAVEQVKELVVGRYYMVDSIIIRATTFPGKTRYISVPQSVIPIHGPLHNDLELGFSEDHYHIDWRFLETKLYRQFSKMSDLSMPWERVIQQWLIMPRSLQYDSSLPSHKQRIDHEQRMMKCKRLFSDHPQPWWRKLESKYKNAIMENFICPHKGLPCNNTPVKDRVVVCRGHGLAWNIDTGKLIPRTPPPLPL